MLHDKGLNRMLDDMGSLEHKEKSASAMRYLSRQPVLTRPRPMTKHEEEVIESKIAVALNRPVNQIQQHQLPPGFACNDWDGLA